MRGPRDGEHAESKGSCLEHDPDWGIQQETRSRQTCLVNETSISTFPNRGTAGHTNTHPEAGARVRAGRGMQSAGCPAPLRGARFLNDGMGLGMNGIATGCRGQTSVYTHTVVCDDVHVAPMACERRGVELHPRTPPKVSKHDHAHPLLASPCTQQSGLPLSLNILDTTWQPDPVLLSRLANIPLALASQTAITKAKYYIRELVE